jgi:PleD family two-component response regulator
MKLDPAAAKILIASDNAEDAALLVSHLKAQHDHVRASVQPDLAVADFESFRPDVLVLAFASVEKAERYSLGLFRQSQVVNQHRHRTVLLCRKEEVPAAFELCKGNLFDDYVFYWPLAQDGLRLKMSVWNAARDTLAQASGPSQRELLAHAGQLVAMECLLDEQVGAAVEHGSSATASLQSAEAAIGAALDDFSRRIAGSGTTAVVAKDAAGLSRALEQLKKGSISQAFRTVAGAVAPITAWPQQIKEQLASQLSGVREFATKVQELRPIVLVIEDDDFARKLIASAMKEANYELVFAEDALTALGMLRRLRPSVILMDINLPDIDGVALTRKVKAAPHLAGIPILMLTGDATRDTLKNSMEAGAAGFIVKPFTRDALLAKLTRAILP